MRDDIFIRAIFVNSSFFNEVSNVIIVRKKNTRAIFVNLKKISIKKKEASFLTIIFYDSIKFESMFFEIKEDSLKLSKQIKVAQTRSNSRCRSVKKSGRTVVIGCSWIVIAKTSHFKWEIVSNLTINININITYQFQYLLVQTRKWAA